MFTKAWHWTLSWASSIHFIPSDFVSLISSVTPLMFPAKILHACHISAICPTCHAYPTILYLIISTILGGRTDSYHCWSKDSHFCFRAKLLACVERGIAEFEGANKEVYDLDALITELPAQKQSSNTDRWEINLSCNLYMIVSWL